MKYPKLPNGPSGPGAAAVRGLQATADSFQTKQGVDYTARLKDGFSRVELSGVVQYLISGKIDASTPVSRQGLDLARWFVPSAQLVGVACDFGLQALQQTEEAGFTSLTFSYPVDGGTLGLFWNTWRRQQEVFMGRGASAPGVGLFFFETQIAPQAFNTVYFWLRPRAVDVVYRGRVLVGDEADAKVTCVFLTDNGRVDSAGRTLQDPAFASFFRHASPVSNLLPVITTSDEEFAPPRCVASKTSFYAIVPVKLTPGMAWAPMPTKPAMWLFFSGDGEGSFTRRNIKSVFAPGFDYPSDGSAITSAACGTWNSILTVAMELMQLVMTSDDAAVIAYPFQKVDFDDGTTWWVLRVVRISASGATTAGADILTTDPVPTSPEALERPDMRYFQSLVYLGNGKLVGKLCKGFAEADGTDFDISLMVSADSGVTWSEVVPAGLGAPLKNQYFGDLFVDKAATEDHDGRLLLPCYDIDKAAYYLFSSIDAGATWTRRARIAKGDMFRRVDSMVLGDGGDNFRQLGGIDSPQHPRRVDPALPDRYVRKPSP